ncbi:hypothetical protein CWB99_13855 [Pseudoalteromonas rubra]|uniref:Uncharacterized protein n=1 Tax=Pseudoalteromonas rubra TaxID=43658 RepID=A0A5S3WK45_9GAMM|nr:hypothetical protein CWB99_13855 [Pseudoalteromonas rubra]TMP32498.1 hypothetical protein CWC00_12505 [Pseudoalteromonas rubra]
MKNNINRRQYKHYSEKRFKTDFFVTITNPIIRIKKQQNQNNQKSKKIKKPNPPIIIKPHYFQRKEGNEK